MGISLGNPEGIWEPIIEDGICVAFRDKKTGVVIRNGQGDRWKSKETEMCEDDYKLLCDLGEIAARIIEQARMADEPVPAKPFGEAVADSWRGIKDWYNGPETSQKTDPSVREHVNAEVDRQIKVSEKQKPFPGILP